MSEKPGYLATLEYSGRWGIDMVQPWCLSKVYSG
jgi:hypothetical protein